jgi:DNA-binding GntR family transcriptional regulator
VAEGKARPMSGSDGTDRLGGMASAAPDNPIHPLLGVRPAASSSGRRLAPLVYEMLKERLLDGEFRAGQRLSVESLRAEYGVSKQPIMDAMRRLSTEGIVDIIPQVGCEVPRYTDAEIGDFFAIFSGTEATVAGIAAQRGTDDQVAQLVAVNDEIARIAADADPDIRARRYRRLNRHFHGVVHDMAHSPIVTELSRRLWDLSDLLINTSAGRPAVATAVAARHADHDAVIATLGLRDPAAARAAMQKHILDAVAVMQAEPH